MVTSLCRKWGANALLCTAILLLVGCATSPSSATKKSNALTQGFTPDEQASYQNAINLISTGNEDKAIAALIRLSQSHPDHFGAKLNLATALYKQKKLNEASDALQKAKAINANSPEAYNLAGLISIEKAEYTKAEKEYLAAIALKDNYADAHYNLALVYDLFFQDLENAVIQYEKYLLLVAGKDQVVDKWVAGLKQKIKRRGAK